MPAKPLLAIIAGPTASGKTALAAEVAANLGTEVVSADSRQIYREMRIGSGAPEADVLAKVRHHFIGSFSVTEEVSAGKYESVCLALLHDLFRKYPVVVMAGGSGFYIDAVLRGFDELPVVPAGKREELNLILKNKGLPFLLNMLKDADPEWYEKVDRHNPQRVIRALEICSTGKLYSAIRKGNKKVRPFRSILLCIDIPREELYGKINARVLNMLDEGLEEEARMLYPFRDLPVMKTYGYSELFRYFDGEISREEATELIQNNTRAYARRQMTWFRKTADLWLKPEPGLFLSAIKKKMDTDV